ncbi:MAG: AIR synthase-related protein, partial [Pseudomonadota bacterium]
DLPTERAHGDFIRDNAEWIDVCTDIADGGLALAAFELAEAADVGVTLDAADTAELFGEDQGRYLIACSFDKAEALMVAAGQAGVPISFVGRFGGTDVTFGGDTAPLDTLVSLYRTSFAAAVA